MKKIAFLTTPILALALVFGNAAVFAGDGSDYTVDRDCTRTSSTNGYGDGTSTKECTYQGNGSGNNQNGQNGNNPRPQPGYYEVIIRNNAYTPSNMVVSQRSTVTWINMDNVPHTVTSSPGSGTQKSRVLQPGERYTLTFGSQDLVFIYHCAFHPEMRGTVTVRQAESSNTPESPKSPPSTPPPTYPSAPSTPSHPNHPTKTTKENGSGSSESTGGSPSATATANASATNNNYNNTYYTSSKETTTPSQPAPPATTTSAEEDTAPAAPAAPAPVTPEQPVAKSAGPVMLPDTGVAGAIAIFMGAVAAGTGGYYLYLRRKLSR